MNLEDFDIDFIRLSDDEYREVLTLSNTFFTLKENSLYTQGDINATVVCNKYDSSININIAFDGTITQNCDRCLDTIQIPVEGKFLHVVKMTSNANLLEDSENYISAEYQKFNFYDILYEHICIAMPSRKLCINSLKSKDCEIEYPESDKEETKDSVWNELKKLKL